ncbi:unnamed protein product [Rhizoctonia solani]|uniref:Uncharacterized protein n=1 Tax=Rhizoctonia solani TaxID=456999 RepID=A0A8H2WK45_9AGAM|nr:unnamed protein product [Rhizoctonia solani]
MGCVRDLGCWHVNGKQASPPATDLLNLRLCWCVALIMGNMIEFGESTTLSIDTVKRLANDDMPLKYHHRHSTSAGLYHEFANSTDEASCLEILRRTFRHETLYVLLDSSGQTHEVESFVGIERIVYSSRYNLVDKLERILHGDDPDSSSSGESDLEDYMLDEDPDIEEDQENEYEENDDPYEYEDPCEYEDPYEDQYDTEEDDEDHGTFPLFH